MQEKNKQTYIEREEGGGEVRSQHPGPFAPQPWVLESSLLPSADGTCFLETRSTCR